LSGAGIRSACASGSSRQLLFGTGAADIAVSVHRRDADARLDVNGQVFPAAGLSSLKFRAVLLRGHAEAGLTTTDDLGEFRFESVSPGQYHMLLSDDKSGVMIVPLQLAA
jgi:hypothetical protein